MKCHFFTKIGRLIVCRPAIVCYTITFILEPNLLMLDVTYWDIEKQGRYNFLLASRSGSHIGGRSFMG